MQEAVARARVSNVQPSCAALEVPMLLAPTSGGARNPNVQCFAISVLQVLAHLPSLLAMRATPECECSHCRVLRAVYDVQTGVSANSKWTVFNWLGRPFSDAWRTRNPLTGSLQHHDSSEFFLALLTFSNDSCGDATIGTLFEFDVTKSVACSGACGADSRVMQVVTERILLLSNLFPCSLCDNCNSDLENIGVISSAPHVLAISLNRFKRQQASKGGFFFGRMVGFVSCSDDVV